MKHFMRTSLALAGGGSVESGSLCLFDGTFWDRVEDGSRRSCRPLPDGNWVCVGAPRPSGATESPASAQEVLVPPWKRLRGGYGSLSTVAVLFSAGDDLMGENEIGPGRVPEGCGGVPCGRSGLRTSREDILRFVAPGGALFSKKSTYGVHSVPKSPETYETTVSSNILYS